jgi:hypothetical protein
LTQAWPKKERVKEQDHRPFRHHHSNLNLTQGTSKDNQM